MNWVIAIVVLYTLWYVIDQIDKRAATAFAILTVLAIAISHYRKIRIWANR